MTRDQIRGVLNDLFPRYRTYLTGLTDRQRAIITEDWTKAFRDVDTEDLKAALDAHRMQSRFFPDVSELLPLLPKTIGRGKPLPYTPAEVERAYYQALWAQAGHTGLVPEGWTGEEDVA